MGSAHRDRTRRGILVLTLVPIVYQPNSLGGHATHLQPQPVAQPGRDDAQFGQHPERCGGGHGLGPPVACIFPENQAQRLPDNPGQQPVLRRRQQQRRPPKPPSPEQVVADAADATDAADAADAVQRVVVGKTVAEVEQDLILDTLDHCLGNRTHAANILGISIRTLRNKLKLYADQGVAIPQPNQTPAGISAA